MKMDFRLLAALGALLLLTGCGGAASGTASSTSPAFPENIT